MDDSNPDAGDKTGVVRETTFKQAPSRESAPATEALNAQLQDVNATTVLMNQSSGQQITAERITMEQSGAKTVDAKSAQLDKSGVVALGTDNAVLLHSGAIQVVAEEARLSRSQVGLMIADKAEIEDSRIFFFAGSAEGDVQAALTPVTAAIAGATFGLVVTLLMLLLGSGSRRRD